MAYRGIEQPLTGTSILLVEDVTDIRDVFAALLASEGAEVVAVGTALDALSRLRQRNFDVVLTDLGLPDVSGLVLIDTIVASVARRPRIVVVTGYGEPHTSEARRAGADAILTKPVAWSRLVSQLVPARDRALAA
jgi:CheY-like chemotaxis protein